jgi:hypothetical protein
LEKFLTAALQSEECPGIRVLLLEGLQVIIPVSINSKCVDCLSFIAILKRIAPPKV